jgi:DNA-binding transcriptional MerR regulator
MGEEHHNDNSIDRDVDRVTISEAASLLGVHPNTVRNRVKDGTYQAEKIVTERGPTWYIDRNSLVTNTTTSGLQPYPQQIVTKEALEVVQDLLRPFVEDLGRVREELGAERTRREQAEKERDELATRLAELEGPPEPREGDPETVVSASTEEGEGVETPLRQEHRPWWRRWFGA